ncbi:hypothetical protein Gotri_028180 [Gossypium trilobum]|uniref:Uncharacterized protein n=1 Tax=Gossypium trilobum TaxID=34281 RepID=A0A7J9FS15_9ROSI|nr:hypothetical protein [Gossypium trilobum]
MNREGVISICAIKYETLPTFCYNCITNQDRRNWRNEIEVIEAKRILCRETCGKLSNKKKRARGSSRELIEDSPSRIVYRKLMDDLSPFKATTGD